MVIPDDLSSVLASNETARTYFENFSASSKKNIPRWIESARTPATKSNRVVQTADFVGCNRMANRPKGRDQGPAPAPLPAVKYHGRLAIGSGDADRQSSGRRACSCSS